MVLRDLALLLLAAVNASPLELSAPGGLTATINSNDATFTVSVDGDAWLATAGSPARLFDGSVEYRAGSSLVLFSVSGVTDGMDATFGPVKRVDMKWATQFAPATIVFTTAVVALQDPDNAGLVFEMGFPSGVAHASTFTAATDEISTAWPIFDTRGGTKTLASLQLSSQGTSESALGWGPGSSNQTRMPAGIEGGAPVVLWPHTAPPLPPTPPSPPGTKKYGCRVVGSALDFTLTKSTGGYTAYTPSSSGYTKHPARYCSTTPAHDWVWTGNHIDEPACQSHCDENACKCFDYNPAHATGETAGTGTAPADETETGPVVARAVALAPLENFMASGVSTNGGASAFGLLASVATVPAGFVHSSVLVAATGVVRTLHTLGDRLLKKGGKSRTALPHPTDLSLNTLGYWTDNGAWYHYLCSECCGGGGSQGNCPCPTECGGTETLQDVMLAVKADWAARKIPANYFMFDSWWYQKDGDPGANATHPWPVRSTGGMVSWTPEPQVFPGGLTRWLDLPTFLHNRCFSTDNVYLKDPRFKDSFLCDKDICMPTDKALFDHIMEVVQPWQPFVYEQDWISKYSQAKFVYNNTEVGTKWLTAMNDAAAGHGMTIQYSMSKSPAILQTTALPAVTQIRGSGDYTPGSDSWMIGHTSMVYWALGVVASKDTLWTTSHQPGCPKPGTLNCTEPNVELQVISATLSWGPVGPGDRLNRTDHDLTLRSCTTNGTILRPRAPMAPLEGVFSSARFGATGGDGALFPWGAVVGPSGAPDAFVVLHHAGPVAQSHARVNATVAELAALPGATGGTAGRYLAVSMSDWGPAAGADPEMRVVDAVTPLALDLSGTSPPRTQAAVYQYWLLAPIDPASGLVLLGELGKVVPLSAQRVSAVTFGAGLRAEIVGAAGETVKISAVNTKTMARIDAVCTIAPRGTATFQCAASPDACSCA